LEETIDGCCACHDVTFALCVRSGYSIWCVVQWARGAAADGVCVLCSAWAKRRAFVCVCRSLCLGVAA
jgi:hypothetical protein